jgi:hypothetical protein
MKELGTNKENAEVDKNRMNNEYYSQNRGKITYMWKNGFKPFEHVRGILAIIEEEDKDSLSEMVNSLSIDAQLKMKELYPMLWMGGTFRKIVTVKKAKDNPTPSPYDLK